jgi:hypothetical protein
MSTRPKLTSKDKALLECLTQDQKADLRRLIKTKPAAIRRHLARPS